MPAASDVRAGGAFVELYTKAKGFNKDLEWAEERWKSFGATLTMIGGSMIAVGSSIGAALFGAAKQAADIGSELIDMSDRTGMAVESLSAFKYALGQSGSTLEEFETSLKRMQKAVADDSTAKTFDAIGVSLAELRQMDPHEQVVMLAEAIGTIEDPAKKTAAAFDIFGKSGTRLLPLFNDGANGLQNLLASAEELGLVMSTEDARSAEEFGDALETVQNVASRTITVIGSAMIPAFKGLAEWITENTKAATAWLTENKGIIINVAVAAVAMTALGAAFVVAGAHIWATSQILLGTIAVVKLVTLSIWLMVASTKAMALAMIASPIIALGITLRYVLGYILALGDGVKKAKDAFTNAFSGMVNDVKQAWSAIAAALAKGDIGAAMTVGLTFAQLEWVRFVGALKVSLSELKAYFGSVWWSVGHEIVQAMTWAMNEVRKTMNTAKDLGFKIMAGYALAAAKAKQKLGLITDEEWEKIRVEWTDADMAQQKGIQADTKAMEDAKKELTRIRDAEQLALNQGKEDELARLRGELKVAQDRFRQAQEEAKKPFVPGQRGAGGAGGAGEVPEVGKMSAAGTFDAGVINRLFATSAQDNVAKQNLKVNEEQLKIEKEEREFFREMLKVFRDLEKREAGMGLYRP
jgi:hypothetical protein